MTDLDTLIRNTDPARSATIPAAGSPQAERIWSQVSIGTSLRQPRRRGPVVLVSICLAVALVIGLVVLQLGPKPLGRPLTGAAAALRRLAEVAASQPALTMSKDQYLERQYRGSLQASQTMVGSTPTPGASANIPVTIRQWANLANVSCMQETFGDATFDAPSNQQAWQAAGLSLQPSPPTTSSCDFTDSVPSQNIGGSGAVDVSALPVDPSTLAHELEDGTTGLPRIDQGISGPNAAFYRAAQLLVEPTVGATPQFWSALLGAMSMFPGVKLLGTQTTQTGATGVAFGGQVGTLAMVVVLSPSTGRLLEARNVTTLSFLSIIDDVRTSFMSFAQDSEGGSGGGLFQWLDPLGSPSVVDSLPPGLGGGPLPTTPTATIDATTNPGVTFAQEDALNQKLLHLPGVQSTGGGETRTPGLYTLEVTLSGSKADLARVQALLRASPLIASFVTHAS